MKRILYLLFLLPQLCFALPKTMVIINAYTGEPDYINNLSSTPISALLGGTTLEQTVENLVASTSTFQSQINVINSTITKIRIDTGTLSGQTAALSIATSTLQTNLSSTGTALSNFITLVAASTANYIDTTGSTQTKAGGLNVLSTVGIGTAQTSSILDVFNGSITVRGTNAGINISSRLANISMIVNGASTGTSLVIDGDLDQILFANKGVTKWIFEKYGDSLNNDMDLVSFGGLFAHFNSNGNMGLGTASPASKFDVYNGSISVEGTNAGISAPVVYSSSGNFTNLYQNDYQVLDISGLTQTKAGGLNLGGALGFLGVPVMQVYGNGNMRVGRTIGTLSGSRTNVFGENAAGSGGDSADTLVIGPQSMQSTFLDGQFNTFGGTGQMSGPSSGTFNMIWTNQSGNIRYGSGNTYYGSLINNGYSADYPNVGNSANQMNYSTLVGYYAEGARNSVSLWGATAIGAFTDVACSSCIVIGNYSNNIGIANSTPTSKLDVLDGSMTVRGIGAGIGITGGGIFAGTGTFTNIATDGVGLRVSSTVLLATSGGFVSIGVTNPADILHINGKLRISSAAAGGGGCFRENGTTRLLEWSNDCVTFSTFATATNASANGWTRSGTTELQTTNTDNVIIGAGAVSRATIGLTVSQSTAAAYLQNTDLTDAKRSFSISDEGAGQSAIALSFRSNPGGGVNNAMLDQKWVNGNDGTSKLIYSFGPNGVFKDLFSMTSSGTFGVGISTATDGIAEQNPNFSLDWTGQNVPGVIHRGVLTGSNGIRITGSTGTATITDDIPGANILIGGGTLSDGFEGNLDLNAYGGVTNSTARNVIRFNRRSGVNTNAETMRIAGDGNVGIGTNNPASKCSIFGSDDGSGGTSDKKAAIQLRNTAASSSNSWYWRAGSTGSLTPDLGMSIADDSAYRLTITSAGTVGIATLSPSSLLDVFNGSITVRGTNAGIHIANTGTGGTSLAFDVFDGTFSIEQNGQVGIGTKVPQTKLHVAGGGTQDLIVGNTGNSQQLLAGNGSGYSRLQAILQGSAQNLLVFNDGGGNVSINTLVGSSKFDVFNGSITIRGTSAGLAIPGVGTSGAAANAVFDAGGNLLKSTSSRKYKRDIQPMFSDDSYKKILGVQAITFLNVEPAKIHLDPKTQFIFDDQATEIVFKEDQLTVIVPTNAPGIEYSTDPANPWVLDYKWATREPGFIAEDFDQAGLTELVDYNTDGSPNAIKYDRVSTYLLEVVKDLTRTVQDLTNRVAILEAKP